MKNARAVHRPISITVEHVNPMPHIRELPQDTQLFLNIKGDRNTGEKSIAEIKRQIEKADFFAVQIDGVS